MITVVFFGSGPVAAQSLELLADNFEIEAVVTKPKPAGHRGDFPVITLADKLGFKTFTASNRQELDKLFAKKPFSSRVAVLIDFGIIVSQAVIDYFPLGIVNSHFSLLPEWRGADPITFSLLSGQSQTGVSLMLINEKMDEGPLLAQSVYEIPPGVTTPLLTAELIQSSYQLLKTILPLYAAGKTIAAPQAEVTMAHSGTPTYSRKLTKDDGLLDWTKPAAVLEREVRAYVDWPKSYTKLGSVEVIITSAKVVEGTGQPGNIQIIDDQVVVDCGDQALVLLSLKPQGKNEMPVSAFLRGYRDKIGLAG